VSTHAVTADAAGRWRIGDLTVNRLGFGAMRVTGDLFGDGAPSDREQSLAVLRRAVELGVNHIDTAAFYFSPLRSANELISAALALYPGDLVIATKVGPSRDTWGAAGDSGDRQPRARGRDQGDGPGGREGRREGGGVPGQRVMSTP
jgi:pyridoxine 4-dehydrogenase